MACSSDSSGTLIWAVYMLIYAHLVLHSTKVVIVQVRQAGSAMNKRAKSRGRALLSATRAKFVKIASGALRRRLEINLH
jgi:hypothetical protein